MSAVVTLTVQKDPYTLVVVEDKVTVGGYTKEIVGIGFAKRAAEDSPNDMVGFELAKSRAMQHIRDQREHMKSKAAARKKEAQRIERQKSDRELSKLRRIAKMIEEVEVPEGLDF
jgi:hypothetical protein